MYNEINLGAQEQLVINNAINSFIKEKKRYPRLEQLVDSPVVGFFFQQLSEDPALTNAFNTLREQHFLNRVGTPDKTKMRKALADAANQHKSLFSEFFHLNLDKEAVKTERFQEVGRAIQHIVMAVQEQVVGNMETGNSKYGAYSSSINDKFISYLKEFFPFYDHIGITTK